MKEYTCSWKVGLDIIQPKTGHSKFVPSVLLVLSIFWLWQDCIGTPGLTRFLKSSKCHRMFVNIFWLLFQVWHWVYLYRFCVKLDPWNMQHSYYKGLLIVNVFKCCEIKCNMLNPILSNRIWDMFNSECCHVMIKSQI